MPRKSKSMILTEDHEHEPSSHSSEEMHCLRCKKKTHSKDVHKVTAKNGRNQLKGVCSVCSSKKCKFIK